MIKEDLKNKKIDMGGKNDASEDDKLMFFMGSKNKEEIHASFYTNT